MRKKREKEKQKNDSKIISPSGKIQRYFIFLKKEKRQKEKNKEKRKKRKKVKRRKKNEKNFIVKSLKENDTYYYLTLP